jgi:hypothetical protein
LAFKLVHGPVTLDSLIQNAETKEKRQEKLEQFFRKTSIFKINCKNIAKNSKTKLNSKKLEVDTEQLDTYIRKVQKPE